MSDPDDPHAPGPTEWSAAGQQVGVGPHPQPWPDDPRYDPELLAAGDTRNVVDHYRYWRREAIVADLDHRRHPLHVAIENFGHDLNIGTVVRTANAFAVSAVHIVGRRRWNRRGAMVTDRYQHLHHHDTVGDVVRFAADAGLAVVAVDNTARLGADRDRDAAAALPAAVRAGVVRADRGGPGGCGADGVHRPVRLDPVDQRRGGGGHRHARLDPPARGPRRRLVALDVRGYNRVYHEVCR